MKSILRITILLFLILTSLDLYSQITITEINKIEEKVVLKPEPYDSLKNWEYHERLADYKQYIGLKVYLPPFENPKIGSTEKENNFLYTLKPNLINVDSNYNDLKIIKRRYIWSPLKNIWDSLKFDKIYTTIYKPVHYYTTNLLEDNYDGVLSESNVYLAHSTEIGNKYFTILNVIYGSNSKGIIQNSSLYSKKAEIDSVISNILSTEIKKTNKDCLISSIWNNYPKKIHIDFPSTKEFDENTPQNNILYVLRNDLNGDTIYCNDIHRFILVPYFIKQKELFQNKKLIYLGENELGNVTQGEFKSFDTRFIIKSENNDGIEESESKRINVTFGSKWICSDVTLMKAEIENYPSYYRLSDDYKPSYEIIYILKNDKDEQIALVNKGGFIEEQNYIKREAEKKLQKEQLLTKKRQEEQVRNEIKRKNIEKRHLESISLFGQQNGELIAQGKVKIGMTKEMCQYAWGKPLWLNKTTTEKGIFENWFYFLGYSLHFENGSLTRIEE